MSYDTSAPLPGWPAQPSEQPEPYAGAAAQPVPQAPPVSPQSAAPDQVEQPLHGEQPGQFEPAGQFAGQPGQFEPAGQFAGQPGLFAGQPGQFGPPAPFAAPGQYGPGGAVPPPPSKRRRRLWAAITGGVALVALVIGLVIWQPWNPPPNAPTAVRVSSPTATTAEVSWTASKGGATPDHYVIFRDGQQAGSVPASQTSWTDTGLTPGSSHQYTVAAQGGGQTSGQTTKVPVTTITPPPVGLKVAKATYSSVNITWTPSPKAPTPSGYTIYDGTTPLSSVGGSTTSYNYTGLSAGQQYSITIVARWGTATSAASSPLSAYTLSAPLTGSVPLTWHVLTTPGGQAWGKPGQTWTDTWQFTASCSSTCTLTDSGEFAPPGLAVKAFTVKMNPSGSGYSGSTTAQVTECGSVKVQNAITLSITPKAVNSGAWTSWTGSMRLSSPYVNASSTTFCPSQSWTFSLTGAGS
jgi:hypothetical protein